MILQTEARNVRLVPEVETYPNMIKCTSYFNVINLIQLKYSISKNKLLKIDPVG